MGGAMTRGFAHAALACEHGGVQAAAHERDAFIFNLGQNLRRRGAEVGAVDDQPDAAQRVRAERRVCQPRVGAALTGGVALRQSGDAGIEERSVEKTGSIQRKGGHGEKGEPRNRGPCPVAA